MKIGNNIKGCIIFIFDLIMLVLSYVSIVWCKSAATDSTLPVHSEGFLYFGLLWSSISLIMKKYSFKQKQHLKSTVYLIVLANIIILTLTLSGLSILHITAYSRVLLFETIGITTLLELLLSSVLFVNLKGERFYFYGEKNRKAKETEQDHKKLEDLKEQLSKSIKDGIISLATYDIYNFIEEHILIKEQGVLFTKNRHPLAITNKIKQHRAIVNLEKINGVHDINALFQSINLDLHDDGLNFTIAETISNRKERILNLYPPLLNKLFYFFDYLYHRVFAKSYPTKYIYNWIGCKNRAISKTELLGRLYACGFEVIAEERINKLYVCVTRKTGKPKYINNESIGGLIKLNRLGKGRKLIGVYKLRTMHPYSEYLQAYMYEKNSLSDGGKINEDFRVNRLGKFMRKMWIDELPMIINILKGEMAVIGVRPLSAHYFSLYTEELQNLRTKYKPGLLPPFYADMPVTLDEIMASELKYLRAYEEEPFKTKVRYFFKILNNIIIKRKRSK